MIPLDPNGRIFLGMTAENVLDISDMDISETGHFRDMDISQNMDISETWKFQRHGHFRDMDISET